MSEPKKVYVVTKGQYSDYDIVAIFSTREKAEEFSQGLLNEIEEYTLDELGKKKRAANFWLVSIYLEDGAMSGGSYKFTKVVDRPLSRECEVNVVDEPSRNRKLFINVTSPVSAEHARKVAVEKRQEYLRTHPEFKTTC